jgi:hypothetical protein
MAGPTLAGCPDLPDNRDQLSAAPLAKLHVLPSKVDLRSQCPKVYDQGQIGSCAANAGLIASHKNCSTWLSLAKTGPAYFVVSCAGEVTTISGFPLCKVIFPDTETIRP